MRIHSFSRLAMPNRTVRPSTFAYDVSSCTIFDRTDGVQYLHRQRRQQRRPDRCHRGWLLNSYPLDLPCISAYISFIKNASQPIERFPKGCRGPTPFRRTEHHLSPLHLSRPFSRHVDPDPLRASHGSHLLLHPISPPSHDSHRGSNDRRRLRWCRLLLPSQRRRHRCCCRREEEEEEREE